MFLGGTMAEGWACYATDLMDECGFLTPDESLAQQHTRARLLARAVVDIGLHDGTLTFDEAVAVYRDRVGMPHGSRARRGVQEFDVSRDGDHVLARHRRPPSPSPRRASAPRAGVLAAAVSRSACSSFGSIPVPLHRERVWHERARRLALRARWHLRSRRRDAGRRRVRAAARRPSPPSNDLLIVGYDREPDTLNRFSTHILEDIQTCVVEGPDDDRRADAAWCRCSRRRCRRSRTAACGCAPTAAWTSTWKLRPGVDVARRPAVHVRRREVHRGRDQRPELQPREHRRVRSHHARWTRRIR